MKPRLEHHAYDAGLKGVFGTFGAGGGLQIAYLQSTLDAADLHKVSLVSEIDGSDRWPVRDLFQRDVDYERVEKSILPWLQDVAKVKFFNPLTLTLIPVDPDSRSILKEVSKLQRTTLVDPNGDEWIAWASDGMYRFKWRVSNGNEFKEFAEVEWDSRYVHLVAIDGQHRLSALKRYFKDSSDEGYNAFSSWNIPVVVSGIDSLGAEVTSGRTILDVVRSMFVYINTEARTPTKARQILLNDEDVVDVCAQEVLQFFHDNDTKPPADRDNRIPPLSLFDWRGATEVGRDIKSPVALKRIVELAAWLEHYLLGEQLDDEQLSALCIDDDHDLIKSFEARNLLPGAHVLVREQFRTKVLPGLVHLLMHFRPYAKYIEAVRAIEHKAETGSDTQRHALSVLRFGSHRGAEVDAAAVRIRYDELVEEILDAKAIPRLLLDEIGMRGVVYAFGVLRDWYLDWTEPAEVSSWLPYAIWFTEHLNTIEAQGWFQQEGHALRRHITHAPSGDVVNFKLEHAERALGAFFVVVIAAYAHAAGDVIDQERFEEVWETFAVGDRSLSVSLRSGYRKRYLTEILEKHPTWVRKRRTEEAARLANQATAAHLRRLRKRLDDLFDR